MSNYSSNFIFTLSCSIKGSLFFWGGSVYHFSENPQHLFQTCGLSIFGCQAPASAHLLTIAAPWGTAVLPIELTVTVLTQNLSVEKRKKRLSSLPWGTVLSNHWSRIEQLLSVTLKLMKSVFLFCFRGLLPPTGGLLTPDRCFTASVLWNDPSPPAWTPSTDWDLL